jgi:hypothetical protein
MTSFNLNQLVSMKNIDSSYVCTAYMFDVADPTIKDLDLSKMAGATGVVGEELPHPFVPPKNPTGGGTGFNLPFPTSETVPGFVEAPPQDYIEVAAADPDAGAGRPADSDAVELPAPQSSTQSSVGSPFGPEEPSGGGAPVTDKGDGPQTGTTDEGPGSGFGPAVDTSSFESVGYA